ncbi:MAG: redoxin family protein [Candidatus Binataceae bacterium]
MIRDLSRVARASIVALALVATMAPRARAAMERPAAPNLSCDLWLNSPPLTLSRLRGKVVLVDFWEYTCINCIRTFPYLRRWNRLYGPLGLVIIGVHTPEFAFGRDPKLVAEAVKRFGLTFPIAVDSGYKVWNAFNNEAWPTKYLIDKDGKIAFVHEGEGDYADFERHIQELLAETHPGLEFKDPKFTPPQDGTLPGCPSPTPETYLGFARGDRIANPDGYRQLQQASYKAPDTIPLDGYALSGVWLATAEALYHHTNPAPPGDSLTLHYQAESVYLVAGSDDGKLQPLYLAQDGKPLAPNARGVDVKTDAQGRTFVALTGKRMYYLVNNPQFGQHELRLSAATPGVSLYSFTFGNGCENAFDRR